MKVLSLIVAVLAASATFLSAQVVGTTGDVRVLSGAGARDFDNGGDTSSGRLIGINTGGVNNFMVYEFPSLSALSGTSVSGATVTLSVSTGFTNGNHGTADDSINLHELALPNAGWVVGTGAISGSTNNTDDGSISYSNRVQYLAGSANGTSQAWLDANGANVANLEGAVTTLSSVSGYAQGSGPGSLSFPINATIAQSWIDNGLAGLVVSTTDDGNDRSRFAFTADAASIEFTPVPEPSGASLLFLSLISLLMVRGRRD